MSDQETFRLTLKSDDGETEQFELTRAQTLDYAAGTLDISKMQPLTYWRSNADLYAGENGEPIEHHSLAPKQPADNEAR